MCFVPGNQNEVQKSPVLLPNIVPSFKQEAFKPLYQWDFAKTKTGSQIIEDQSKTIQLKSLQPATIRDGGLVLNGTQWLTPNFENPRTPKLPQTITLESICTVSSSPQWCGLIGAIQDNGTYERGCLLGIQDGKFFMAVASRDQGKLTYLQAPQKFDLGRKYHLTGSYDGSTIRLYVDGKKVNQSVLQSGPIQYDEKSWLTIGAYKDSSELHCLTGSINCAAIYQGRMSDKMIAERYQKKRSNGKN